MAHNTIVLTDVSKQFSPDGPHVIDQLSLTIPEGQRVALVGPSGCGKSTLISMISGLTEQTDGVIGVEGEFDPHGRLARCAWMPQQDLLFPWLSVEENVGLSLRNRGASRKGVHEKVAPMLDRFGLGAYAKKAPYEMSGGMRQRASFIRTMLTGKQIILFDEPFGALDSITRADLQEWLHQALQGMPTTTIMVTHDVEEALILSDRVIVMARHGGAIVQEVPGFFAYEGEDLRANPAFVAARERVLESLNTGEMNHA
jgi:NitT/TauT family transport system ATP-binding protein